MRYTNQFTGDAADDVSSPAPDATTELDQRIAEARDRLGELDRHARRLVKERPMAAFGLALGVGLLLGRALSRR